VVLSVFYVSNTFPCDVHSNSTHLHYGLVDITKSGSDWTKFLGAKLF
jgi:hypothetical protein